MIGSLQNKINQGRSIHPMKNYSTDNVVVAGENWTTLFKKKKNKNTGFQSTKKKFKSF